MPKLSLATCCKVLREIATIQVSQTRSPLNQTHKSTRLKWVRKYKKMDLFNVTFTNKWISSHHCSQVQVHLSKVEEGSCPGQPSLMMVV